LNADGTPHHQNPARFETDGTTLHTNYLYAKVDVLNDLRVRDGEVRFYIKHPGAGGGASNLQLLGTAPVPDTVSPGSPQTVFIPWQIPSGTPNHSCTFSVIHTPAEPAEDINALNWNQTEQLIRDKNDWAQRNLSIDTVFSNLGNTQNIRFTLAPIFIEYPKEKGLKSAELRLFFKSNKLKFVNEISLEIPALKKTIDIKPGKNGEIVISKEFSPGSRVVIIPRLNINSKGMTFDQQENVIEINPILGKTEMIGYAYSLEMNKSSQVIWQVLDRGLAGLIDIAEVTSILAAEKVAHLCRNLLQERTTSPDKVVEIFKENIDLIKSLQKELKHQVKPAFNFSEIDQVFVELIILLEEGGDNVYIFDCFKDLFNRTELISWYLYNSLRDV
jgi:hypothetical protein